MLRSVPRACQPAFYSGRWARTRASAEALHSPWTGAPVARSAVAGMGAGIGIGMGYTDCKHEFDQMAKEQAGQ